MALAAAAPRALDQEENKLSYHIYFPPALESENKRITWKQTKSRYTHTYTHTHTLTDTHAHTYYNYIYISLQLYIWAAVKIKFSTCSTKTCRNSQITNLISPHFDWEKTRQKANILHPQLVSHRSLQTRRCWSDPNWKTPEHILFRENCLYSKIANDTPP